jgi:competence protein ComEC
MVAPLLLYQNGTFSVVALPANLFALLPVPWAMFFALIAGVNGIFFGGSASIIALPAYALLWYVVSVAHFFASLPFASVSVPSFSAGWMLGAYAILFAGYFYFKTKAAPYRGAA